MSDFSKTEWNILKIVAEQHGKSFQRGAKLASLFEDSFPKHQKEILDNFFYEIDKDLYIPLQMNHLHGLYEPASRRMRTTLTETEPTYYFVNYQAFAC